MHTRDSLAADFRRLGVSAGDVIMLHASIRSVGEVAGGPDEILNALKDVLTDSGTIMMYAGCPQYVDEVGRGNLSPDQEAEVLEKLPAFDANTARCDRSHGALAEFFRTTPGIVVSQHPTRFAAWGRHAAAIVANTPWDFAFGADSPLARFHALDGKILLLGSDHDAVTFLHHVEHVVDFPDKIIARFKVPVHQDRKRVWRDMKEVDSSKGAHANWPSEFFARLVDTQLVDDRNPGRSVGNAHSYLISARTLFDAAASRMQSIAANGDAAREMVQIRRYHHAPVGEMSHLLEESQAEDFRSLARLIERERNDERPFAGRGGVMIGIERDGRLVAVGGVMEDPYRGDPLVGRLRHVYVARDARRTGLGAYLIRTIEESARPWFHTLTLGTDTEAAAAFYDAIGFERPTHGWRASHIKRLR